MGRPGMSLINVRFGRLVVIGLSHTHNKNRYWLCKCDCNNYCLASTSNLIGEGVSSCGCYKKDLVSAVYGRHYDSGTAFYEIWCKIKARCFKESEVGYKNYGGRGITMCDRWLAYDNFKADMYQSYLEHIAQYGREDTSIERIDNNGNYDPANCKWATRAEQSLNKRNTKHVSYQGKTYTIPEAARKFNIGTGIIRYRLNKGWDVHLALTTPPLPNGTQYKSIKEAD